MKKLIFMTYPSLPVYRNDRVIGMYYLKDEIVIWNGKLSIVYMESGNRIMFIVLVQVRQEHKK